MRIDNQGRILIPREYRQRLDWADSFNISFSQDGGQLILTPQRGRECSCCMEFKRGLQEFGYIRLCSDCIDRIAHFVKDEDL